MHEKHATDIFNFGIIPMFEGRRKPEGSVEMACRRTFRIRAELMSRYFYCSPVIFNLGYEYPPKHVKTSYGAGKTFFVMNIE
jgi:hypothetical protein